MKYEKIVEHNTELRQLDPQEKDIYFLGNRDVVSLVGIYPYAPGYQGNPIRFSINNKVRIVQLAIYNAGLVN